MSTYADLDKPPFYTAIYMDAGPDDDPGLHSEATATLISAAMILTGFMGFRDDMAAESRAVKIVFWKNYATMKAWEKTAGDLLPNNISMDECIASSGCLWRWLDQEPTLEKESITRVA